MSLNIYIIMSDSDMGESATVVAYSEEDARKMFPSWEYDVNVWLIGVADESYTEPCVIVSSFRSE
jgi:hypothetical protein